MKKYIVTLIAFKLLKQREIYACCLLTYDLNERLDDKVDEN